MSETIDPSTYAMSATSLLSASGGMQRDQLEKAIGDFYGASLTDVAAAVDEAIRRGLVQQSGSALKSILPVGYVVSERDRTGDGWTDWIATDHARNRLAVSDLLKGAK